MTDDKRDVRKLTTTATADQVYAAWADPMHIAAWFADRATGTAEAGGTITHFFDDFGMELPLQVIEAIPGARIVFEGVGPGGVPFRQEIHIRTEGGETTMELVHYGFDEGADFGDEFEGMDSGWKMALAILRRYLENYFGRSRTVKMVMQPAPVDKAKIDALYRSEAGLARWLTTSGHLGDVGDPVALSLRGGATVTGKVLAWTGTEVAFSVDEIDGVVELKSFPMGPAGHAIAVRACSWAQTSPDWDAWTSTFRESLHRLAGCFQAD